MYAIVTVIIILLCVCRHNNNSIIYNPFMCNDLVACRTIYSLHCFTLKCVMIDLLRTIIMLISWSVAMGYNSESV